MKAANVLQCLDCSNWIPIDATIDCFCYKKEKYKLADGTPVFARTTAYNPCHDFTSRGPKNNVDWPKHVYGAGSIIVPILLWIASHGGTLLGVEQSQDHVASSDIHDQDILEDILVTGNSLSTTPILNFGPLTQKALNQTGLVAFYNRPSDIQLDTVAEIHHEYSILKERLFSLTVTSDKVRNILLESMAMSTDEIFDSKNEALEIWKVANIVLFGLGMRTISEWELEFLELEEYLKTVHGDDDFKGVVARA